MAETEAEPTTLKDKLKKAHVPVSDINKFLAYVQGEKTREATAKAKDVKAYTPVTNNTVDQLYTMAFKFWNLGLVIDGVNVVITGRGMALPTYHGYKNKVKQIYPDATFDTQLVREGDTFQVAKESGEVVYSHQIANPFDNKPIVGAYCVIKFGGNEYLETLNSHDYKEMKGSSKNPGTWDKWESEFWLKSVIKRACKRHFNDVTIEIDRVDNETYGLADQVRAGEDKKAAIIAAAKGSNDNDTRS